MTRADILEAWGMHLAQGRRRSPHTVRAYVATASRLLDSLGETDWSALARLDANALRRQLAERRAAGIGNASAARELSALKAFVAFAQNQSGMTGAAPPTMRGPRVKKGLPRPVTPDDAVNLAATVAEDATVEWIGARDRAVLLLLYGAGMRIAEALSLKGKALPLGDTLTVTGKGGKQRVVPLLPIVREAVADYAAKCPWPMMRDEPLFRGAKGGPLAQGMVQKATARRALRSAFLPAPRRMRCATVSRHICWEPVPISGACKELLGHASLSSTQIYTKVDAATLLDVYRNAHPRERD